MEAYLKVGETFECLADLGQRLRGVDDAHAPGLGFGKLEIAVPHALEEGAVLALEAVELLPGEALLRYLVAAVEDEGPVGASWRATAPRRASRRSGRPQHLPRSLIRNARGQ